MEKLNEIKFNKEEIQEMIERKHNVQVKEITMSSRGVRCKL